jgi:hypothetical protein
LSIQRAKEKGLIPKEATILTRVRKAASKVGARLFRNQVGLYHLLDGRVIRSGLCKGSSDLIGWHSIVITPAMVGRRVAVFMAIEGKRPKKSKPPTSEQKNFIKVVREAGGIAGVVRHENEALALIADYSIIGQTNS